MPFARLSDRLEAKNAQIVSERVLFRPGWSDVVFAFHDAEEIGPRMHVFSIRCWMFDVRRFVHQERNRPAGRSRAGRFELIPQARDKTSQLGFL
jgi:hypothetical protein